MQGQTQGPGVARHRTFAPSTKATEGSRLLQDCLLSAGVPHRTGCRGPGTTPAKLRRLRETLRSSARALCRPPPRPPAVTLVCDGHSAISAVWHPFRGPTSNSNHFAQVSMVHNLLCMGQQQSNESFGTAFCLSEGQLTRFGAGTLFWQTLRHPDCDPAPAPDGRVPFRLTIPDLDPDPGPASHLRCLEGRELQRLVGRDRRQRRAARAGDRHVLLPQLAGSRLQLRQLGQGRRKCPALSSPLFASRSALSVFIAAGKLLTGHVIEAGLAA